MANKEKLNSLVRETFPALPRCLRIATGRPMGVFS